MYVNGDPIKDSSNNIKVELSLFGNIRKLQHEKKSQQFQKPLGTEKNRRLSSHWPVTGG